MSKDVQVNDTLYGEKVPSSGDSSYTCEESERMKQRGIEIDRANFRGTGQPTTPDSPGEEGL